MSRFIEEFYYGNIDPQARSTKENKAVQKKMEILMNNEDLLTNALTDKPKKWFLDYVERLGRCERRIQSRQLHYGLPPRSELRL